MVAIEFILGENSNRGDVMNRSRQITGKQGEDRAVELLRDHGYQVLERNFRCRLGEVDIVAKEGQTWCFIEVKARTTTKYGLPEEAVDYRKQNRLRMLANYYIMQKLRQEVPVRFDVVAIQCDSNGNLINSRLIKGAF